MITKVIASKMVASKINVTRIMASKMSVLKLNLLKMIVLKMTELKRLTGVFLLLCFIMATGGCSSAPTETASKVVAPQNRLIPLQGTWIIEKCITDSDMLSEGKGTDRWVGKTAVFSEKAALIGGNIWQNVEYKIKRVNAEEYLLYTYRESLDKLGIRDKEIYVVTLSSNGNFLFDFIRTEENEFIAKIDNEFFCLRKVSDAADIVPQMADAEKNEETVSVEQEEKLLRSGVLLGVRTPEKAVNGQDEAERYSYRTIWIASQNREVISVMQAPDLFVPRMSGFWKLESDRVKSEGYEEDVLRAYAITDKKPQPSSKGDLQPVFWENRTGYLSRAVLYAGNDYVSIEVVGRGQYKDMTGYWQENLLQTLPIDDLSLREGIKISDVMGENGRLAVETAVANLFSATNVKRSSDINGEYQEQSFALFRKTGYWFIKGRVNFKQKDDISFTDLNLNLIPSKELVAYDVLHLSWTHIKDRIPRAIDAFTSPNRDMAVILTRSDILVYAISGEELAESPLKTVKLREGDTVVMAEWATGDYVGWWENAFLKYNNPVENLDE